MAKTVLPLDAARPTKIYSKYKLQDHLNIQFTYFHGIEFDNYHVYNFSLKENSHTLQTNMPNQHLKKEKKKKKKKGPRSDSGLKCCIKCCI